MRIVRVSESEYDTLANGLLAHKWALLFVVTCDVTQFDGTGIRR
jgi:hypothetical protein